MKKACFLVVVPMIIVMLSGCTTAGPFVTNIYSDGKGGLDIEKARVECNGILGTISTVETTTSHIQVIPGDKK